MRFAGIVSAYAHQTQRGGMGAVMGSKNLKAIVIRNPVFPDVADAATLEELARLFRDEGITRNQLNAWQKEPPGFSYWMDVVADPGYVLRAMRRHTITAPRAFAKGKYGDYLRRESPCPGCANDCIKTFNTGRYTQNDRVGGATWETPATFAINLDLKNLETYFDLNVLCMLHGLDPVSTGGVLAFAAESAEKGTAGGVGLSVRVRGGSGPECLPAGGGHCGTEGNRRCACRRSAAGRRAHRTGEPWLGRCT